jgi:hypothetical protein
MSMSTHVVGFAPPDEKWQAMKQIWDACKAGKVPIPREVEDFFNGEKPDPAGVNVELTTREWRNDYAQGIEIDLADIPKHVKTIRFYNAW